MPPGVPSWRARGSFLGLEMNRALTVKDLHVAAPSTSGGCRLDRRLDAARGTPDALFSNLSRGCTVRVEAAG